MFQKRARTFNFQADQLVKCIFKFYLYNLNNSARSGGMGKKTKKQSTTKSVGTFPINKNKSFQANFTQYLKILRSQLSGMPAKQYLRLVHQYIEKCSLKLKNVPKKVIIKSTSQIKICKQCEQLILNKKQQIQCGQCEDFYHYGCLDSEDTRSIYEEFQICSSCFELNQKKNIKNSSSIQKLQKTQNQQTSCNSCRSIIDPVPDETANKCLKCSHFYHKECFGDNGIVCAPCNRKIEETIQQELQRERKPKTKQLTIRQSFKKARIRTMKKEAQNIQQRKQTRPTSSEDFSQKFKQEDEQSTRATLMSYQPTFKSIFPEMSEEQIEQYKKNLLFAITAKNMKYVEELQPQNCEIFEDNQDSVDFGIEDLNKNNYTLFKGYKEQPVGPFLIEHHEKMGYNVKADKNLPKGMIICEYVGDVYTHRDALELEQNDSVMELKKGRNADETLFIIPTKFTNIARYINGINPKAQDKANVKSHRSRIRGRPAVILYTSKQIKKGQGLFYDYNAGQHNVHGYDTSGYI